MGDHTARWGGGLATSPFRRYWSIITAAMFPVPIATATCWVMGRRSPAIQTPETLVSPRWDFGWACLPVGAISTPSCWARSVRPRASLETKKASAVSADVFRNTAAMQEMIQGQGIIDIVNSYIATALRNGLVGLLLFVGFFFSVLVGTWRRMNSADAKNTEMIDIGRALLAALACILVTIATVSSISFVPMIYYAIAGLAVAYARIQREKSRDAAPATKIAI